VLARIGMAERTMGLCAGMQLTEDRIKRGLKLQASLTRLLRFAACPAEARLRAGQLSPELFVDL